MMNPVIRRVDWVLVLSAITLVLLGLTTMKSFGPPAGGDSTFSTSVALNYYFSRQIFWLVLGAIVFFLALNINWDFLKINSITLLFSYFIVVLFLAFLWLGMALVGGIKTRHIGLLSGLAIIGVVVLWNFYFLPHQKDRILAFLEPARDVRGSGYHALQSTIAVGS